MPIISMFPSSSVNTSDATATEQDLRDGKSAYGADGKKFWGSLPLGLTDSLVRTFSGRAMSADMEITLPVYCVPYAIGWEIYDAEGNGPDVEPTWWITSPSFGLHVLHLEAPFQGMTDWDATVYVFYAHMRMWQN